MNRSLTATIASVVFTGASLFGLSAASADPGMAITSGGTAISSGSTPAVGQVVDFAATDCKDAHGAPGYVGLFISQTGDPAADPSAAQAEAPADADGGFTASMGPVVALSTISNVYVRWYCASQPVSSLDDPNVLYGSSLITITLPDGTARVALHKGKLAVMTTGGPAKISGAKSSSSGLGVSVDPDALPTVDRINIPGDQAAILKSKTDTWFDGASVVSRIYSNLIRGTAAGRAPFDAMVAANRPATEIAAALYANPVAQSKLASLTDTAFLNTAFKAVLFRAPTADELATFTAYLAAGEARANVLWKTGALNDRTRGNSSYVTSAFAVAGRTRNVPGSVIKAYTAQLDSGATTKVKVVEDIVLASR